MKAQAQAETVATGCAELKLENQLCFPLYACAKEVIHRYKPFLDAIDLTYTQYITMMILWDKGSILTKELGQCLYLDSGTLTPLLKKLEGKGYVKRERFKGDERNLIVAITEKGLALREAASEIPGKVGACIQLKPEEAQLLYVLLYKVLEGTMTE